MNATINSVIRKNMLNTRISVIRSSAFEPLVNLEIRLPVLLLV